MPDNEILQQLAAVMAQQTELLAGLAQKSGIHIKAPATHRTANPLHGWNGLFSTPGLNRDVITAHIRPFGIGDSLPLISSIDQDPRFGSITGFTAPVGSQPTDVCEDAPYAYMKGCNLTARFGRIRYDTNTIDMDDVMLRVNRGDFTDLMLRGQVLGLTDIGPEGLNQNNILNLLTMSEMVTVGVLFERELTRQIWQGSFLIANEFPGLDVQIATGQKDADTNVTCPALDSDVKNFNYHQLDSTIVTYMSMLEYYIYFNASMMGLLPARWVWSMRPELWQELTEIWPCAYNTNRCASAAFSGGTTVIDGRENITERDAMRNGMYIEVNGRRYDVIVDQGIFEHNNANNAHLIPGEYASTIYFVPMTIVGGMPVTYREYVDYKRASSDVSLLRGMEPFWTDRGIYSWAIEFIKWCYKFAAKTEQRVILLTPQLAGRIDAVKYSPLQHLRSPDPASPYFMDGGVSIRPANRSPYAVWSGR